MLPLIWLVCGIWFYRSAQKLNAHPWAWVGVMLVASYAAQWPFAALLALILRVTVLHSTDARLWVIIIGTGVLDAGFVVALHAFMVKRVPFRKHAKATAPAAMTLARAGASAPPAGGPSLSTTDPILVQAVEAIAAATRDPSAPRDFLPGLERSLVDTLGQNLLGKEKYEQIRKGVGEFPTNVEELRSAGREILLFATPAEKARIINRKAADVLFVRIAWKERLFYFSNPRTIEQKFTEQLKQTSLPSNIFSGEELLQLINALDWFLTNMEHMPFKWIREVPILAPYSSDLITPADAFRGRTRVILAWSDLADKPVELVDYVGYLADTWYGVPYAPSPLFEPKDSSETAVSLTTPKVEAADEPLKAHTGPQLISNLSDKQLLEKLQRLQKTHFQAQAMNKSDSIRDLIDNVVPKLAHLQAPDSTRIFAVYHKSIGSPPLVILRACSNSEDLRDDLDALLEDYSVHVEDRYSIVVDPESSIASIAVHNKGSANGRVMNVFVWHEPNLQRFIGLRGTYTDSTGLTVGRSRSA